MEDKLCIVIRRAIFGIIIVRQKCPIVGLHQNADYIY